MKGWLRWWSIQQFSEKYDRSRWIWEEKIWKEICVGIEIRNGKKTSEIVYGKWVGKGGNVEFNIRRGIRKLTKSVTIKVRPENGWKEKEKSVNKIVKFAWTWEGIKRENNERGE